MEKIKTTEEHENLFQKCNSKNGADLALAIMLEDAD